MREFNRSESSFKRSIPGYRFRRDSTQINSHYWVGLMAEGATRYHLKQHPEAADPMTALNLPTKFDKRLGHNIGALGAQVDLHARWKNLTVLLLLTSALERYIADVAVTAINSDPLLHPGFPKMVDGLLLNKYGLTVPQPDLQSIVKGTWPSRMKALRSLFGDFPNIQQDTLDSLEKLREKRNDVAHGFGVDRLGKGDLTPEGTILVEGRGNHQIGEVRVSNDTLIKYFDQVQKFVDAVDEVLLEKFIGDYEPAVIYLQWKKDPDNFERMMGITLTGTKKSYEARFMNFLNAVFDRPFGRAYCHSLEAYVKGL